MYAESEISSFALKARVKLGDLAEDIFECAKVGEDTDDLLNKFSSFRLFLNALHSPYQNWSKKSLLRRTEDMAYRYSIMNTPYFDIDWMDKMVIESTYEGPIIPLQIPESNGILYKENEVLLPYSESNLGIGDMELELTFTIY